jgi:predicted P-loop ATPase
MSSKISIYNNACHTKGGKEIPLDIFLYETRDGKYQDVVLPIRAISDKEKRDQRKKSTAPGVTISGTFSERTDSGIISHSGFIAIDIDNVDPEEVKSLICPDRYVYAAFTSIGGRGLCVIFKINGDKHDEAFKGLQEYLYVTYGQAVDRKSSNISRLRFVSYDPHLYINEKADKFALYPKKEKALNKIQNVVFVQSDFDKIVDEICSRRLDITGSYHQWLNIAYGIADKFGESGRDYFHKISQYSPLYEYNKADRQYTACLKPSASGKRATLGSFYYFAKQAGLQIVAEKTKIITQTAALAKKGRRTKEDTLKLLEQAEGIAPEEAQDIVNQVFENNIQVQNDGSLIEIIISWLRQSYAIERNEITRKIEVNGKEMDDILFNDLFCACKILFDKANAELLQRIINSNSIPSYNPFFRFFDRHKFINPGGIIKAYFKCIETDTGTKENEFFPDYTEYFGKRWLVGIIASIHGQHSPLMLVLSGKQGTGKTEFFRQLLPAELRQYFAESKMDNEKDDSILMCKKLLIMDDEWSGKSKKEEKRMKELLSKQTVTVREPYGRFSMDLQRLAVFCGTTNDQNILNDPTGNRRIIPIDVLSIDFDRINRIDRTELFMEAYHLYKSGFHWHLTREDVKRLNDNTGHFEQPSAELELINKYFRRPDNQADGGFVQFMTVTEIKSILEMKSGQKLNPNRIGSELKRMGWEGKSKRIDGQPHRGYYLLPKY